jgi:hypothetical protein
LGPRGRDFKILHPEFMKIKVTQLPDIDKYRDLSHEYDDYGRFGVTLDNHFYVLPIHSSHLARTNIGGYWAVNRKTNTLFVSPRNIILGFEEFILSIIKNGNFNKIVRAAGLHE